MSSDPTFVKHRRSLRKTAAVIAGAAIAVPVVAAACVAAVDALKRNSRKHRSAPRPGTFHTQVKESPVSIYTDGDTLYDDMLEAIDSASDTILMESYIWKNDAVGQRFVDAFNAAAQRGVDVYLIYDGFANLVIPRAFYRQLSEQVRVFRMAVVGRQFWKGPLRYTGVNHSKILVVDDAVGFVGGYNIGSLYAREWRDTHVRVTGPGVSGLRQSITRIWNEAHDADEQIPWLAPESWDPAVRVAANQPVQLTYPIRNMYLQAFDRAQHHIWIATPYFIPDQQILQMLIEAARRGVDVRVMLPEQSNHVVSDWVSRGFFGPMLDAGITILLYRTSMMHSKTATIDGEWSTVGTANLDRLSLTFNYETNLEIIDAGFASELEKVFAHDFAHCVAITSPAWRDRHPMARVVEAALVPLRPLL